MSDDESMLDRARAAYDYHSGRASDLVRQLGFAGIAIVWAFRVEDGGRQVIASELKIATALIVVALALDLLQYVVGAAIWGAFARIREKRSDPHTDASPKMNWPAIFLFWVKVALMMWAYVTLLCFLWREAT
jgi:hypothetical protein